MTETIGDVLPAAVGVALSPVPIIAVILMLVTKRAGTNGPAFVIGWVAGLAVVGALVLAVAGPADDGEAGDPATWAGIVQLCLGALLLVVAARQFGARPHGDDEPPTPRWMGSIEGFGPGKAAAAGVVLSGLNPKNTLLSVSAAATVAESGTSGTDQALAYGAFVVIATIGVAAPVVIYVAMGERAKAVLDRLKGWMAHNNAVIMAVLCLVLGAKLIGQGVAGLAG